MGKTVIHFCFAVIAVGSLFIWFDSTDTEQPNITVTHLDTVSYAELFELNNINEKDVPTIDIVITWAGIKANDSNIRTRYNGELKYCLRSIYTNIPWFHKVYLVVNNQTYYDIHAQKTFIDQIKLKNNRMEIINTLDLFCIYNQCSDSINNTNSESIETVLHRIPNLSEYYIYFNDDVFIGSPVHWKFFFYRIRNNATNSNSNSNVLYPQMPWYLYKFYKDGVAVPWYLYWINYMLLGLPKYGSKTPYINPYAYCKQLNISASDQMTFYGDHMPRAYVKRNWELFEFQYLEWFSFVRSHKTRYYPCMDSVPESVTKAYMKWKFFGNDNVNLNLLYYPIYDDLYYNILVRLFYNGFIKMTGYHHTVCGYDLISTLLLKYHLTHIKLQNPATININDDGQSTKNMQIIRDFYANYFPVPSPIEKQQIDRTKSTI